jgi:hypothetical protein
VGHSQLGNNGLRSNDFDTTVFANLYKLRLHFVQDGERRTLGTASGQTRQQQVNFAHRNAEETKPTVGFVNLLTKIIFAYIPAIRPCIASGLTT